MEEAEPIPAKKMKLPIVSDGEIDAFVKSGMLPAANEDRKEVKIAVPVEPEKDDVLDLKRAGMSDELGFDFADGLTPATVETTTTTTTEEEEEEEQKEVQEPEQEKKPRTVRNKMKTKEDKDVKILEYLLYIFELLHTYVRIFYRYLKPPLLGHARFIWRRGAFR